MNKSILVAMASGLLCCIGAAAATAGEPAPAVHRVTVEYGDLDLQSPEGRKSLEQRLTQAARNVCPGEASRDLGTRLAGRRCVRQAVESARNGVSDQQLARAAAAKADRG